VTVARLLDLMVQSHWFLAPVLLLCAFIVAVAAERYATLWREPRQALPILQALHRALLEGGTAALIEESERYGDHVAGLVRAICDNPRQRRAAAEQAVIESDERLEGALPWLQLAVELLPLTGGLMCVLRLTSPNEASDHGVGPALALSAAGLLAGAGGWCLGFAIEQVRRRRVRTLSSLAQHLCEVLETVGGRP
jgi:biopolymer transport protein ExbB/TolQ